MMFLQQKYKIPLAMLAVFFLMVTTKGFALERSFKRSSSSRSQDQIFLQKFGDAIVVSSISDARTFIPILASDSASSDICGMVFNGLVKYDKELNIVGDLADRWEISDGDKSSHLVTVGDCEFLQGDCTQFYVLSACKNRIVNLSALV